MRIKTRNSLYEVEGTKLYRNGVLETEDIIFIGNMATDFTTIYSGKPQVGSMLYVEYLNEERHKRYIRTSTIMEVQDVQD